MHWVAQMGCRHFRWRQLSCCCADTEGANRVLCQPQLGDCFPPSHPPLYFPFFPPLPAPSHFLKKRSCRILPVFFRWQEATRFALRGILEASVSKTVGGKDRPLPLPRCMRVDTISSSSPVHFLFFNPPCSFCFVPAELYTLGLDLSSLF